MQERRLKPEAQINTLAYSDSTTFNFYCRPATDDLNNTILNAVMGLFQHYLLNLCRLPLTYFKAADFFFFVCSRSCLLCRSDEAS